MIDDLGIWFGFEAWICFSTKSTQTICNLATIIKRQTIYIIFVQYKIQIGRISCQITKSFPCCAASLVKSIIVVLPYGTKSFEMPVIWNQIQIHIQTEFKSCLKTKPNNIKSQNLRFATLLVWSVSGWMSTCGSKCGCRYGRGLYLVCCCLVLSMNVDES